MSIDQLVAANTIVPFAQGAGSFGLVWHPTTFQVPTSVGGATLSAWTGDDSTANITTAIRNMDPSLPGSLAPMERIRVNGLELAYLSEGSGPLAILLHGFPD